MKFRKKPVVIEATQYFRGDPTPAGVCLGECAGRDDAIAHVHTLEGDLTVSDGDWVITGQGGEHWPVKPDKFVDLYDPLET